MANNEIRERMNKLREERIAREKARIEKLREFNLKKYSKTDLPSIPKQSVSSTSITSRPARSDTNKAPIKNGITNAVKNNLNVNNTKRPITAPVAFKKPNDEDKSKNVQMKTLTKSNGAVKDCIKTEVTTKAMVKNDRTSIPIAKSKISTNTTNTKATVDLKKTSSSVDTDKSRRITNVSRKSMVVTNKQSLPKSNVNNAKRSPPKPQVKTENSRQSVFERLYKPKVVHKETVSSNAVKLQTDPSYLKKVVRDSNLIFNKRHTVFEPKTTSNQPVRRSISAVHFKRISKNELSNCIHKWASIGEKLNKVNLNDINEDDQVSGEVVVSAVKSERKRVKFQTPVPFNFNTPTPEELQSRLKNWLQKRGKSLDSFHHLQCFGIHHLTKHIKPLHIEPPKFDLCDDENKENIPLESDSDDDSYTDNMNEKKDTFDCDNKVEFSKDKWRRASNISDCGTDVNESTDTITSNEVVHHVDDLLLGALNDLTQLLKEGFDWEQCARWLRAIRERFPSAPERAEYWECRAALEERRGDLPASVQCWEEAIATGTKHSVVEANLDQMLDKFLRLRISPGSGRRRQPDPKMVDVKNVFKSTIIRFAVQQAKLRRSGQSEHQARFTVTPVRRSGRLTARSPLRVCASVDQARRLGPALFRPNKTLDATP